MSQVTSRDGTTIDYEQSGAGPVLILVGAALSDWSDTEKLARALSEHFTVVNFDRRGRGCSGDTLPYAVDREVEDLMAIIDAVGGAACVFGSSSGAVLALRAAAADARITSLALFEPPFRVDPKDEPLPADIAAQLEGWVAAGRRRDAVKYFMANEVGVPGALLVLMRLARRMWAKLEALAHTLPYDYAVMGDTLSGRPLADTELAAVSLPTLVIDASKSPPRLRNATEALTELLPNAERRTLQRQSHAAVVMAPKVIARVLTEFFQPAPPERTR